MSEYEKAARAAGFTIRAFGSAQKIARNKTDGKYVVSENGWRYACEDANIKTTQPSNRPGWEVVEDIQENRINFVFISKPAESIRTLLKTHGFRWSPTRAAWTRQLNNAGRSAAEYVASRLNK